MVQDPGTGGDRAVATSGRSEEEAASRTEEGEGPGVGPLQRRSSPFGPGRRQPETASWGINTPDPLSSLQTPEGKGCSPRQSPLRRGESQAGWTDGGH